MRLFCNKHKTKSGKFMFPWSQRGILAVLEHVLKLKTISLGENSASGSEKLKTCKYSNEYSIYIFKTESNKMWK